MHKYFPQTNKEALASVLLALLYFLWWYICAYFPGDGPVEEYTLVFGMPLWFFLSCVLGTIIFPFLSWIMVHFFFKEIPLTEEEK